jgi:hypothetical protein
MDHWIYTIGWLSLTELNFRHRGGAAQAVQAHPTVSIQGIPSGAYHPLSSDSGPKTFMRK